MTENKNGKRITSLYTMLLDDITLNAKQYESKENFDLGF